MNRDELLEKINEEVKRVLPENEDLDGDSLDDVQSTVEEVLNNATSAIDGAEDEEEEEEPEQKQSER